MAAEKPSGDQQRLPLYWRLLDGAPSSYVNEASELEFEQAPLELDAVAAIYRGEPLTAELIQALDPDADLERIEEEARQIGYPVEGALS